LAILEDVGPTSLIVRAEAMGGSMSILSEVGKGMTTTVTAPA
jgi:signal transduction histidine kinase